MEYQVEQAPQTELAEAKAEKMIHPQAHVKKFTSTRTH
jgi:hypothetical protein